MLSHGSIVALFSVALTVSTWAASTCDAQTLQAPTPTTSQQPQDTAALETKPPEETPFPLVLRIDKSALLQLTNSDVDEHGLVDMFVLGTHAVGESRTLGSIRGVLIPDSTEASFDVRFQGNTVATTVGTHKPAVIYSRTFTDFNCTSHIAFDPRQGFVVVGGDVVVNGDTRLVFDGFAAMRPFGRRLICRMAERRARQSHEQARKIADRDNKRQVREGFERQVAEAVRAANERTGLARYVNRFLGDQTTLQLYAKSSTDCIHIGIGPAGEKYELMTALPPSRDKSAPIEIWVYSSILSPPVAALVQGITPQTALPPLVQTKILEALLIPTLAPNSSIQLALEEGWLVLGLPEHHPVEDERSKDHPP